MQRSAICGISIFRGGAIGLKRGVEALKHVNILYLEVNEKELYKDCALIGDIDDFVGRFGFTRLITKMTKNGWGDAIYVKTSSG